MRKKGISSFISQETVEKRIYLVRGKRVMLDRDLSILYKVTTKALNQAVKRNLERFPDDFMFRLNNSEKKELVTNCDRFKTLKHSTSLPYVFTESGVAMLSSVLSSHEAIQVNIQIIRTFIRMREIQATRKDLWLKIDALEKKYDQQFQVIFKAIKLLLDDKPKKEGSGGGRF